MTIPARILLAAALTFALSSCGDDPPARPPGGGQQGGVDPAAEAIVTGDGSTLCIETADLPPGYLPVAGQDNTQNALDSVFGDPAISATAQERLTASWSVLPQGGASLDEQTADCAVYVFDGADIDDIYAWYTDTYPSRSQPAPVEEPAPAGAPGEDPHVFHFAESEFSGRESFTYVFRFRNVIARVGVDAAGGEIALEDALPIAEAVQARLEAAVA